MSIISCQELTKTYITGNIRVEALRGITLEIKKGEMVAIMGPSGCGKTTLLNCLSGLDEATSGRIWVEDIDLTTLDDNQKTNFRAHRMGFVFQFYNLLPVLSATENVELPLLICGSKDGEARNKAQQLLERVGLKERATQRPASLSGGERQRVAIARALVNNPAIVFADEPTGDLDKKTAEGVVSLLRQLNKEQEQTFVLVTHDPEVGASCDRIIHMRDGLIMNDGGTDEIPQEIEEMG
ncbi:MAG TPA: ABC transporter ATP-binding protein [Methanomassiliicoccales archaeon]|nr:ABC transporter ATP-binding protein [Methanomassiliicoccales archaeon]